MCKDGSIWDQGWQELKFDKNCKGINEDSTNPSFLSVSKKRKPDAVNRENAPSELESDNVTKKQRYS